MSATESRSEPAIQLAKVQNLYDRHQYLDAYNLTSELWQDSTDVQRLSTDELILASRLAAPLAWLRIARCLLRAAPPARPPHLRAAELPPSLSPGGAHPQPRYPARPGPDDVGAP